MRTMSGIEVDLNEFSADDVNIMDIALALSHLCRFNGHVAAPFSVAEHSIIGSRMSPNPTLAMEFLLHDTGEAFIGDIILPVKELFPEIGEFENSITAIIFDKLWPNSGRTRGGVYTKSPYLTQQDYKVAEWESLHFRPSHQFRHEVWTTRGDWEKQLSILENDIKYTPLQDIFVSEYLELKDELL